MASKHNRFPAELLEMAARTPSPSYKVKVLLCFVGLVLFEFLTSARSDEASAISPNARGNVVVLDNALLDRTFGRKRAAIKNPPQDDSENPIAPRTRIIESPILLPHESFGAKMAAATPGRRAVALRLAEKGRRLLRSGEYKKALVHFEKALDLDCTSYQPYIYFYLARTHDYLGNYQQSSNFLEVAGSWLYEQPAWTAEVETLRENTFRARNRASHAHTDR
jgi:tetratricopeptide (TPR) repeat protein